MEELVKISNEWTDGALIKLRERMRREVGRPGRGGGGLFRFKHLNRCRSNVVAIDIPDCTFHFLFIR